MAGQEPSISTDLAKLIYGARERIHAPSARKWSQKAVADAVGIHLNTYAKYERGECHRVPVETLDKLADVLELSPGERRTLFELMVGHQPPARPAAEHSYTPDELIATCARLTVAAYVRDRHWNVLATNRSFLRWFPTLIVGTNVAEWVLTSREARQELIDWNERWALPILQQLNTVRAETRDPVLTDMWNRLRRFAHNVPETLGKHTSYAEIREKRANRTVVRMLFTPLTAVGETPFPYTLTTIRTTDEPVTNLLVPTPREPHARNTARENWNKLAAGPWQLPEPRLRR